MYHPVQSVKHISRLVALAIVFHVFNKCNGIVVANPVVWLQVNMAHSLYYFPFITCHS